MEHPTIIMCIDFDGVICDSVLECFVSSWIGYHTHYTKRTKTSVAIDELQQFREYRPFIRRGEDYLVIQHCIAEGLPIGNQRDFDFVRGTLGKEVLSEFYRLFYTAREQIINSEKDYWLHLNPLFDWIEPVLREISGGPQFHIVSTKKVQYIQEILNAQGIEWDQERLHYSGDIPKIPYIGSLLDDTNAEKALFIDDQLDHFINGKDKRIQSYLASWGYVKPEWLTTDQAEVLQPRGFIDLVQAQG